MELFRAYACLMGRVYPKQAGLKPDFFILNELLLL